jgi:hypothetical protein
MERRPPEKLNYWKTSSTSPDTWIDKTIKLLDGFGAELRGHARGHNIATGEEAFMLEFSVGGDAFRIVWPVLTPKKEEDRGAARRQAATMMYHDVKARLLYAEIHGARNAFLPMLLVDGGAGQVPMGTLSTPELPSSIPLMLGAPRAEG